MASVARVDVARARPVAFGPWALTLAATGVVGAALRVWVYRSDLGVPNSDEAVVGLMARHLLHGEFPTFFWGQAYGGPQEAILAIPGILIADDSWLALRMVPLALFLVSLVLVWRVGLRKFGRRPAAMAAAL